MISTFHYKPLHLFILIFLAFNSLGCGAEKPPQTTRAEVESLRDLMISRLDEFKTTQKKQTEILDSLAIAPSDSLKVISDLQTVQKKQMELLDSLATEQKAIKSMVPSDSLKMISEILERVKDITKRPKTENDIDTERKNLQAIFSKLHPLAAPLVMVDISKANWALESLFVLDKYKNISDETLSDAEDVLGALIERNTFEDFMDLKIELENLLKNIETKNLDYTKTKVLEMAKNALNEGKNLESAYASLENYENVSEKAKVLRKNIRQKVLENSLIEQLGKIEKQLNKTILIKNSKVKINSLATILENLTKILVDLETEEDWSNVSKEIVASVKQLSADGEKEIQNITLEKEKEKEKEYLIKLKNYQRWALAQIRLFDSKDGWNYDNTLIWVKGELTKFKGLPEPIEPPEFIKAFEISPSLPRLIEELLTLDLPETVEEKKWLLSVDKQKEIYGKAAGNIGWKFNIDTEITYRIHRDAMVKFLLPIQTNLLDPPIYDLFLRAHEKGQRKLDGRDNDKIFLAEQALKIQKKSLNDF